MDHWRHWYSYLYEVEYASGHISVIGTRDDLREGHWYEMEWDDDDDNHRLVSELGLIAHPTMPKIKWQECGF